MLPDAVERRAEKRGSLTSPGSPSGLARVKPAVAATLDRDGVLELIGPDHIHGNVHRAVQAQEGTTADNTGLEPT